jgi:hypothetical protein
MGLLKTGVELAGVAGVVAGATGLVCAKTLPANKMLAAKRVFDNKVKRL